MLSVPLYTSYNPLFVAPVLWQHYLYVLSVSTRHVLKIEAISFYASNHGGTTVIPDVGNELNSIIV